MVVVLVPGDELVFTVVLFSVLLEAAGDSFTTVVLFSVLFSPGGLTVVLSFFSQAASKAMPAKRQMYFFISLLDDAFALFLDNSLRSSGCGWARRRRGRRCVRGGRAAGARRRRHCFGLLLTSREQRGTSENANIFLHSFD